MIKATQGNSDVDRGDCNDDIRDDDGNWYDKIIISILVMMMMMMMMMMKRGEDVALQFVGGGAPANEEGRQQLT